MDASAQKLYAEIQEAIATDQLILPTLPEVALQIREKIELGDCSFVEIAELLGRDASLSANFLRIANSPLYRGIEEIIDLQTVVNRMGMVVVRDLVISLALKQIFMATTPVLDKQFRAAWSTSVGVAAISRMLAVMLKGLSAEQALLAGLIHNIGVLPVLVMLEKQDASAVSEEQLSSLLDQLQGPVGKMVLEAWEFPQHMLDVVQNSYKFDREHEGDKDYVDLIQVSLLQGGYASLQNGNANIPAFAKLNIDPEVNLIEIEENKVIIEDTQRTLGG